MEHLFQLRRGFQSAPHYRQPWRATASALALAWLISIPVLIAAPAKLRLVGDWEVEVTLPTTHAAPHNIMAKLSVEPPKLAEVVSEPNESLAEWIPAQPGWARKKLPATEDGMCSACFALVPGSVKVSSIGATPRQFKLDKDFQVDWEWGAIGRVSGGDIGSTQAVSVSCQFMQRRLDSIVLNTNDELVVRKGKPHIAIPLPPELRPGEERVANLWLPAHLKKLTGANLFPILETSYPESPKTSPSAAERLLPKTMAKLHNGEPLKTLAWGDSVTAGYLGGDQWQAQFVRRLEARFPKANLQLVTIGWGTHTSQDFLNAPPGHPCNYSTSVLAVKPDLVVSEFANDCTLDPALVERNYEKFLADFQHIGAEWIILTPHLNTFMGLSTERGFEECPQPYVPMVRRFAHEHDVALADATVRYVHLWRQGIPYSTLMINAVNHPDVRGMAIFADSLMELFP